MKVALVHDYLREYGGAERVLESLHQIYPDAPVYTSFVDRKSMGIHWRKFEDWDIIESWMTKIPLYKKLYSPLRLIAINFFEQFDFSEFDVVISSSNMYFSKGVITKPWVPHICYCHTPPRSIYGYTTMSDWKKNPIVKIGGEFINLVTKKIDYSAAQRVDYFIANSKEVQGRIQRFYKRDSVVIHPPVEIGGVEDLDESKIPPYFLYVNRLAFSKHPELAIEVCNELKQPLKIVGVGKYREELEIIAGPTVEFLGGVSDEQLARLYKGATALLYPVEDEDFGIVPVEAMGHGVPVIAHNSGGPKETIIEGKTGVFFDELTKNSLLNAIKHFHEVKWDKKKIYKHATQFSKERFRKEIEEYVERCWKQMKE